MTTQRPLGPASQITFLYYRDLAAARDFYSRVMGFELVEDQQWAAIYRTSGTSFVGVVDEAHGSLKARADSAVLLTLVVDDVPEWHRYLAEHGVKIVRGPGMNESIQVEFLFVEDPGGYQLELQTFHKPALGPVFHGR